MYNLHLLAWHGNKSDDLKPFSQFPNLFSSGFFPSGIVTHENHPSITTSNSNFLWYIFDIYQLTFSTDSEDEELHSICYQTLLDQELVLKKMTAAVHKRWRERAGRKSALTVSSSCLGTPSPGTSGTCTGLMQE